MQKTESEDFKAHHFYRHSVRQGKESREGLHNEYRNILYMGFDLSSLGRGKDLSSRNLKLNYFGLLNCLWGCYSIVEALGQSPP
jgi:hypothetical protein